MKLGIAVDDVFIIVICWMIKVNKFGNETLDIPYIGTVVISFTLIKLFVGLIKNLEFIVGFMRNVKI